MLERCEKKTYLRASVPCGASTGIHAEMTSVTPYCEIMDNKRFKTFESYQRNGIMVFKSVHFPLISELLLEINESKAFDIKNKLVQNAFDGDNGEEQENRKLVHLAKIQNNKRIRKKYQNLVNLTDSLKIGLLDELDSKGLNFCKGYCAATIFQSIFGDFDTPQVIHCDDLYDNMSYNDSAICMVAMQNNTLMRVICGSHRYDTLEHLLIDKTNNCKFSIPAIIRTMEGECLLMHPKVFHSGWTCESDNIRLQLFFGYHRPNEVQIFGHEISAFLNGDNAMKQIKALRNLTIQRKRKKSQHLNGHC